MAIPGVVLLTFMSVHLFQFRLGDTQTNSIWATFARQVASRSRVRHSALPVALRRHVLASKNPAALGHAPLTQSGHDLHMLFDTVPTGFEQAGEIPHRALLPSSCCVLFSRRHVFVTAQLPPWFRFVGQLADHQPGTTGHRFTKQHSDPCYLDRRFQSVFNGSDEQTTAGHVFACGSF